MEIVKLRHYAPQDLTLLTVPRSVAAELNGIEQMIVTLDGDKVVYTPVRA